MIRKEIGDRYAKGRFELQSLTAPLAEQVFVKYRGQADIVLEYYLLWQGI